MESSLLSSNNKSRVVAEITPAIQNSSEPVSLPSVLSKIHLEIFSDQILGSSK
jgi:hypothetical protein